MLILRVKRMLTIIGLKIRGQVFARNGGAFAVFKEKGANSKEFTPLSILGSI